MPALPTPTGPARLQRLHGADGSPTAVPGHELWLDGGHNPGAGEALAVQLAAWGPTHLIVGMKQAKDTAEFLRPLLPHAASLWAVAEPEQHSALPVDAIVAASGGMARPGPTVSEALGKLDCSPGRVLICGSLYLAGEVLKADGGGAGMIDRLTEADRPRWTELWSAYLSFYNAVLPPEQFDYTWDRLMSGRLQARAWRPHGALVGITHSCSTRVRGR